MLSLRVVNCFQTCIKYIAYTLFMDWRIEADKL